MGQGRRLGLLGLLSIMIAIGSASACGSVTAIEPSDACVGDDGGSCSPAAAAGPGAKAASSKAKRAKDLGDSGGSAAAVPDTAMPPCTVCARADVCCKAQGQGGCHYTASCVSARTTGEQQWQLALCQAALGAGGAPGVARCGPRNPGNN